MAGRVLRHCRCHACVPPRYPYATLYLHYHACLFLVCLEGRSLNRSRPSVSMSVSISIAVHTSCTPVHHSWSQANQGQACWSHLQWHLATLTGAFGEAEQDRSVFRRCVSCLGCAVSCVSPACWTGLLRFWSDWQDTLRAEWSPWRDMAMAFGVLCWAGVRLGSILGGRRWPACG